MEPLPPNDSRSNRAAAERSPGAWHARRRGDKVTIRGFVPAPRGSTAIFDRISEPRTDTRTWRFYWNPPSTDPHTEFMTWVEHCEEVPMHVRTLKVVLPSGDTAVIRSQRAQ